MLSYLDSSSRTAVLLETLRFQKQQLSQVALQKVSCAMVGAFMMTDVGKRGSSSAKDAKYAKPVLQALSR